MAEVVVEEEEEEGAGVAEADMVDMGDMVAMVTIKATVTIKVMLTINATVTIKVMGTIKSTGTIKDMETIKKTVDTTMVEVVDVVEVAGITVVLDMKGEGELVEEEVMAVAGEGWAAVEEGTMSSELLLWKCAVLLHAWLFYFRGNISLSKDMFWVKCEIWLLSR